MALNRDVVLAAALDLIDRRGGVREVSLRQSLANSAVRIRISAITYPMLTSCTGRHARVAWQRW